MKMIKIGVAVLAIIAGGVFTLSQLGDAPREVRQQPMVNNTEFSRPRAVTIDGYNGAAMEPFLSRDGQYLFFNNGNDPGTNTNLYYAQKITDTNFLYIGEVKGANSPALDGVASLDADGNFYFVTTRDYEKEFKTLHQGVFRDGAVSDVRVVEGISREKPWWLSMDAEISPDGKSLYYVDNKFGSNNIPKISDIFVADKKPDGSFKKTSNSDEVFYNINNGDLNYAPAISKDGLEIYFTRAKLSEGKVQIYVAKRGLISEAFGMPELVSGAEGFVEGSALSPDDRLMYYHKKIGGNSYSIFLISR